MSTVFTVVIPARFASSRLPGKPLQDIAGNSGLFIVAVVSGLTDADASVLSTLHLFNLDKLTGGDAVIDDDHHRWPSDPPRGARTG